MPPETGYFSSLEATSPLKILTPTPGRTDTSTVDTNEQRHRSKQQGERGAATVADNKRERSALPTASTDGWRSRRGTVLAPLLRGQ